MAELLRYLFFLLVVRPLVLVVIGLNVRHRERLPRDGPAIIVANHNSHLDALVLMTLFPQSLLRRLRPVADAEYFLRGRLATWLATRILGIIPVSRRARAGGCAALRACSEAIEAGCVLVFFPEGTRGEPERLGAFKGGIAHLARRHPDVAVVPVFLHGLGKSLPKGEALFVPFLCDVYVGKPVPWQEDHTAFMSALDRRMRALAAEEHLPPWE